MGGRTGDAHAARTFSCERRRQKPLSGFCSRPVLRGRHGAKPQVPQRQSAARLYNVAAPSAAGGRNRPCRTPDRAISKSSGRVPIVEQSLLLASDLRNAFRSINIEDFHDLSF